MEKYVKVPLKVFEALMRTGLSLYERRVIDYIIRQTYGWNKHHVDLNLSRLARAIAADRSSAKRALKALEARDIIEVLSNDMGRRRVRVNTYTLHWKKKGQGQLRLAFNKASAMGKAAEAAE